MNGLEQQIEKKSVFMYPDKTAFMMNESVQVISTDFVLGLLADYEKEEQNIRGALAETITKLTAKIEYLEREIVNMKEVKKESVCILRKQLEEIIAMIDEQWPSIYEFEPCKTRCGRDVEAIVKKIKGLLEKSKKKE